MSACVCVYVCTLACARSFSLAADALSNPRVDTEKTDRTIGPGSVFEHRFDGRTSGPCRIRGPSKKCHIYLIVHCLYCCLAGLCLFPQQNGKLSQGRNQIFLSVV